MLGWFVEFLKKIRLGGSVVVNARKTNQLKLFMQIYQTHLCVTALYTGLDVPTEKMLQDLIEKADLDDTEFNQLKEAYTAVSLPSPPDGCSMRLYVLWEMLRVYRVDSKDITRRAGQFLMFWPRRP
jgi:cyanate lyase